LFSAFYPGTKVMGIPKIIIRLWKRVPQKPCEGLNEGFPNRNMFLGYDLRAYPKIISEAAEKSGCLLAKARAN
jgi:hypothetical protein